METARVLAADAAEKVGDDPADTDWLGRDRFFLSAGQSSLTQYIQLDYGGFGLKLGDLESLRTWGSLTPGRPESGHAKGVEITRREVFPATAWRRTRMGGRSSKCIGPDHC